MSAPGGLRITRLEEADIDGITRTFETWHKYRPQYESYLAEQAAGQREVYIARLGDDVVGYVTLVWHSPYEGFAQDEVPEICDLNVFPTWQRRGIGSALIAACEEQVRTRGMAAIGISVVQCDPDYAAANRLYPQLGYKADGRGITPTDQELHLIKPLAG